MSGLSSFVFFVYFLCGSTNQRPPKFPGLSTFAKKWFMACPLASPYKPPPVCPKIVLSFLLKKKDFFAKKKSFFWSRLFFFVAFSK